MQLYGRADEVRYQSVKMFSGSDVSDCPRCWGIAVKGERRDKLTIGVGKPRPNVILYGDKNPN